jgi:hypothetical protein
VKRRTFIGVGALSALLSASVLARPAAAQATVPSGPGFRAPAPVSFRLPPDRIELLGHVTDDFQSRGRGEGAATPPTSPANRTRR